MPDTRPLIEERSKLLYGQVHRLSLMVAIAESNGRVNPSELSWQLRISQSAFQKPLQDLEESGLLVKEHDGRKNFYVRVPSKHWEAALETRDQVVAEEREGNVVELRPS